MRLEARNEATRLAENSRNGGDYSLSLKDVQDDEAEFWAKMDKQPGLIVEFCVRPRNSRDDHAAPKDRALLFAVCAKISYGRGHKDDYRTVALFRPSEEPQAQAMSLRLNAEMAAARW